MLLKITNKCRMMCTHCFSDSNPNGRHMDDETFEEVIRFIQKTRPVTIVVSGGEPFEHPKIIEWLMRLRSLCNILCITSNGMFLENESYKKEIVSLVEDMGINIQITNDPRFYPIKIKEFKHRLFTYETHLPDIVSAGRAIANNIPSTAKNPKCFDMRVDIKYTNSLRQSINNAELSKKACSYAVDDSGNIRLCEMNTGYIVGHVSDDLDKVTKTINCMKCNRCGLFNNISKELRDKVGE